jgi:polyisoprenoid-binding protein YceI
MTARLATHLSITALSVLSAAFLLAAPAMAQTKPAAAATAATASAAKLVPAQSDIAFTFRQMGVPVDGHFKKFDAQLAFDPKNAAAGKVSLSIELASATIGDAATDAELVKPEWFDTKKIPTASFQSTSIKTLGGGKFEVAGKLTIKGQVHDTVVPVALTQAGGTTTATGAFAMKRLDFKIGEGEWKDTSIVANDVQVKFKLAIAGMAPL